MGIQNRKEALEYIKCQRLLFEAELEGMKVMNEERRSKGESLAYDEKALTKLIDRYSDITHNGMIAFLEQYS